MREKAAPQLEDAQRRRRRNRPRALARVRGGVPQSRFTMREKPSYPLAYGRHAHRVRSSGSGKAHLSVNNVADHFQSTDKRESGILVDVHSAESLKGVGWVAPPSLSNSVRMNSNNVLELHI